MLEALTSVTDPYFPLYDEDYYMRKMDTLDIHSVYTDEVNKIASNPIDSSNYDTSNPCEFYGKNGHTSYEYELLKKHYFLKIDCIQFLLCKKWLDQL